MAKLQRKQDTGTKSVSLLGTRGTGEKGGMHGGRDREPSNHGDREVGIPGHWTPSLLKTPGSILLWSMAPPGQVFFYVGPGCMTCSSWLCFPCAPARLPLQESRDLETPPGLVSGPAVTPLLRYPRPMLEFLIGSNCSSSLQLPAGAHTGRQW